MCRDCAVREVLMLRDDEEYESDAEIPWPPVTDAMRECAALVGELYGLSAVGGPLHIVVDDYNVGDEHLAYCRGNLDVLGYPDRSVAAQSALILDLLAPLTTGERATVLALADGYL